MCARSLKHLWIDLEIEDSVFYMLPCSTRKSNVRKSCHIYMAVLPECLTFIVVTESFKVDLSFLRCITLSTLHSTHIIELAPIFILLKIGISAIFRNGKNLSHQFNDSILVPRFSFAQLQLCLK